MLAEDKERIEENVRNAATCDADANLPPNPPYYVGHNLYGVYMRQYMKARRIMACL